MDNTETKVSQAVKKLFDGDRADVVIGYAKGTLPLRSRPCFIDSAGEVDKLVWNSFCSNNLAVYLPRFFEVQPRRKKDESPPRVGITAKACDIRSIVGLVKEKQVLRENIVIVGVSCGGMIDPIKVLARLNGEVVSACEEDPDGTLRITTRSGPEKTIPGNEVLADACIECQYPVPDGADVVIEGAPIQTEKEKYTKVKEFESMPVEERWKYFTEEISKCIRCYACRQACPNCYCKVCFADQTMPRWIGSGTEMTDVMLYHIGRIFHQAGRCVGCDACVRACPMNIDLRTFTEKLVMDVKELFDYTPGLSWEAPPPLCTFREDDDQSFITEP